MTALTIVKQEDLIESVAAALQYISYYHPVDYIQHLARAYEQEQNPAAKDVDPQVVAMYRELKELSSGDRQAIQTLMDHLRGKK